MQIVIDIPQNLYKEIMDNADEIQENGCVFDRAIANGTPLPKGHGRLIDADELYDSLIFPTEQFANGFKEILDDAPTVIADKAESEDNCGAKMEDVIGSKR